MPPKSRAPPLLGPRSRSQGAASSDVQHKQKEQQDQQVAAATSSATYKAPATSQLDGLVLTPAVGEFPDVEPDAVFVVPFVLHNTGTRLKSVRFTPPRSTVFRLLGMPQSIAPGMKVTMEVEFCSKSAKDFHDAFVVRTEEGQLAVPLHAWFPSPHITFDRVVDLGKVSAQHPTEPRRIKLVNSGKRDGHFQLTLLQGATQGLSVTPPSGVVPAGQEKEILVHFFAQEIGQFRSSVQVEVEGLPKQRMDVVAEVVEAKMVLLHADSMEPLTCMDFGRVFFGKSKATRAVLKNHGQHEMSFAVRPPEQTGADHHHRGDTVVSGGGGGGGGAGGGGGVAGGNQYPIQAHPSEGRIPAGGSCELKFTFSPVVSEAAQGWDHQRQGQQRTAKWDSVFSIEVVESEQRIDLQVIGMAMDSDVSVSQTLFAFPDTAVNESSDVSFAIVNENSELPITYAFSRIAHFTVQPEKGRLMNKHQENLIVTFKPNQMGSFSGTIDLIINNGARVIPLRVRGKATAIGAKSGTVGGVDKIPEDFLRKRNFHDLGTIMRRQEEQELRAKEMALTGGFASGSASNLNDDDDDTDAHSSGGGGAAAREDGKAAALHLLHRQQQQQQQLLQATRASAAAIAESAATKQQAQARGGGSHEPDLLLFSEWHQKREHDHLYSAFIANSRKARDAIKQLQRRAGAVTNPNDLGMVPGEGLVPPTLKLILAQDDPLLLGGGLDQGGDDQKKSDLMARKLDGRKVDENKLIKRKYPREPRNRNEARECKLILSPKDMQSVIVPIKWLSFGTVNVYSRSARNFVVQNLLKTHILVSIPFSMREELAQSTPTQQIVPPGQTAGFDVIFMSESPQNFQQAIYFTINETHKLKFVVVADVRPIDIQMSSPELNFRFPEAGTDTTVTMPIVLSNPGNSNAEFSWSLPSEGSSSSKDNSSNNPFTFNPASGVVPASGSTTVEVTYAPTTAALESSTVASLKIKGGVSQQKQLKLVGSVQPTQCGWKEGHGTVAIGGAASGSGTIPGASGSSGNTSKEARVDFKKVSVGSLKTQTVTLKNTGTQSSAVFAFEQLQGFVVSPMRGRIPPGGHEEITVQLKATQPATIKTHLSCYVRGMKQLLRLQLHAECKLPEFSIVEPSESGQPGEDALMDFGGVYVGSSDLRRMVIQNHDDIVASFLIDFTHHPEYCLTDGDRRPVENTVSREEDVSIPAGGVGLIALYKPSGSAGALGGGVDDTAKGGGGGGGAGGEHGGGSSNNNDASGGLDPSVSAIAAHHQQSRGGALYRVSAAARQTLSFYVRFTPSSIGAPNQFLLPISLFGTDITSAALRPIVISAEGRKPRLILNPTSIDFGSCVVVRDGTSKSPNNVLVQMSNETDSVLQWELVPRGHREGATDAFRVAPTSGRLQPGLHSQIQFTFTPTQVRSYHATCAVYLDGRQDQRYVDIEVKGIGANPGLSFDRHELVLPPVPLDVPATATFHIINEGYESLDLKVKVAGDGKLPITLNWPRGQTITSSLPRLPVEVVFLSKRPMTFTVNLDFLDNGDGIFSLPVTCCADNSLLSNFSYLLWRERGIAVGPEGDRKPILLREVESWPLDRDVPKIGTDNNARGVNGAGLDEGTMAGQTFAMVDAVNRRAFSRRAIDRLRLWINANLFAEPVDDLVLSMQQSHGKILMELIEALSGKQPFSAPAKRDARGMPTGGGGGAAAAAPSGGTGGGGMLTMPGRKQDVVLVDIDAFESVLLFLKQYGACVSDVRPEFLLRFEDYSRLQDLLSSPNRHTLGPVNWRVVPVRLPEKKFQIRATHAWVTMVLQTIRVLYLARITWKALKAAPPSPAIQLASAHEKWGSLAQEPTSVGSNILSVPEGLLLKWLTVHLQHDKVFSGGKGSAAAAAAAANEKGSGEATGAAARRRQQEAQSAQDSIRIVNFDEDLRDCKAWAACVIAYLPSAAAKFDIRTKEANPDSGFTVAPATAMEFERNATILIDVLVSYGINPRMTARELLENSARDNLLFTSMLFHALPQYLPKSSIKFRGKLLEKITKTIELTNPSRMPVDYDVVLDGDRDFKLLDKKLRLEPKSSASFSVSIAPRFSSPRTARLYFVSSHAGAFNAATLSFALETDVEHDCALKTIDTIEASMYEQVVHEIMVENPFQGAGTFVMRLQHEYMKPTPSSDDAAGGAAAAGRGGSRVSRGVSSNRGPGGAGGQQEGGNKQLQYPEEESLQTFPDAFYSPSDSLTFKLGERSTKLTLQFMPMVRGKHKVRILFTSTPSANSTSSPEHGEFAYTFIGTCHPPKAFDSLQVATEGSVPVQREVPIPVKNALLDKAFALVEERFKQFKRGHGVTQRGGGGGGDQQGSGGMGDGHGGGGGGGGAGGLGGGGGGLGGGLGSGGVGGSGAGQVNQRDLVYKVEFLNDKFVGPNPFFSSPSKTFQFKNPNEDEEKEKARRAAAAAANGATTTATGGKIISVAASSSGVGSAAQTHFNFPFTFQPRGPGTYNCLVLLSSPWDVRLFSIEAKSRSPGMKGELEFCCAARQQIVQEIPITNSSDKEWVVTAKLSHADYFSGPRELRVLAGRTRSYNLTFAPPWITEQDINGTLELRNQDTQEKYTYTLKGRAEEPLAENTIVVECKARESRKITVSVPNITFDDCAYTVETDLPFVSGEPKLQVAKHDTGKYVLHVNPQLSGKLTGSLTFYTPNRQYLWYVVQVTVNRPPPEETLTIETEVRKGVVADILISNPKDRIVDFVVRRRHGDAGAPAASGLFGEDIMTLQPNQQNAVYQLAFAPTQAGQSEGAISFNNDDVGEFWFQLKLKAREAVPESQALQCELGRSAQAEVLIDNPTDTDCIMAVTNSNETNFSLSPATVVLRPKGTSKITVTYMPSAIQVPQEAKIVFSHAKAGVWEFLFTGVGMPPTRMEPVVTSCHVSQTSTGMVTFRNPFPMPKKFQASLKIHDDSHDDGPTAAAAAAAAAPQPVFSLMTKRLQATLGPFHTMQIPFSYTPKIIAQNSASVFIHLLDPDAPAPTAALLGGPPPELRWEFPIVGNAEGVSGDPPQRISCPARKRTSTIFQFALVGFNNQQSGAGGNNNNSGDASGESFTSEVRVAKEAHYGRAASNSIELEPMSMMEAATESEAIAEAMLNAPPHPVLFYRATFEPLRPFTVNAEVLIRKDSGGVWKFPIVLEAGIPEADDVIVIEAAVNQRESVSFNLFNILSQPSPFVAYFAADSPPEFSVAPTKGVLPAMPTGGAADRAGAAQPITISFASTQYGKTLSGTLVVETEDMHWRYEVRGTLPHYQPPSTTRTRGTRQQAGAAGGGAATTGPAVAARSAHGIPKPPVTGGAAAGGRAASMNVVARR